MKKSSRTFDVQVLFVCSFVVGTSILLTPDASTLALGGFNLPPLCAYRFLFGFECFGCGLTRSFTYMGHLDFVEAWEMHKLGPLLWTIVALQVPYRGFRVFRKTYMNPKESL